MKRFLQHLTPALVMASSALLAACGGGGGSSGGGNTGAPAPGTPNVERYALATSYNGGTLSSFAVDAQSGQMRLVDKKTAATSTAVALRPGYDQVLSISNSGGIYHYALQTTGRLDYIYSDVLAGNALNDIVVHPSGDYVYVADGADGIYQLDFDEYGQVVTMEPQGLVTSDNMDAIFTDLALSRDGNHLYATDIKNGISHFSIGNNGDLTFEDNVLFDSAWKLISHPGKDFLYAIQQTNGALYQYEILPDGTLDFKTNSPFLGGQLEGITLDNSGKYLYISDLTNDVIWQLGVADNGVASLLDNNSIDVPITSPRALKSSPISNRIYLSDQNGAAMLPFIVGENGELAAPTTRQIPMDAFPTDLVFTTGKALTTHNTAAYVINSTDDNVSQFLMGDDGSLTPLGVTEPVTGDNPSAIIAHPTGKYVYILNQTDETVTPFRRVTSTLVAQEVDELEDIPSADPVDTGTNPSALAIHPSGNYLYVVNKASNEINLFPIAINGSLSADQGPYQVGFPDPADITIDPTGRFLWAVTDNDPSRIVPFSIDASDGSLTKLDAFIKPTAAPNGRSIAVTPDGQALYISHSSGMQKFLINDDGSLDSNATEGALGVTELLVSAQNVLYAVNEISQSIAWFGEEAGSVSADNVPAGIAVAPTGQHLLLAVKGNGMLTRFGIQNDGSLVAEESVAAGGLPVGVAIVGYTE